MKRSLLLLSLLFAGCTQSERASAPPDAERLSQTALAAPSDHAIVTVVPNHVNPLVAYTYVHDGATLHGLYNVATGETIQIDTPGEASQRQENRSLLRICSPIRARPRGQIDPATGRIVPPPELPDDIPVAASLLSVAGGRHLFAVPDVGMTVDDVGATLFLNSEGGRVELGRLLIPNPGTSSDRSPYATLSLSPSHRWLIWREAEGFSIADLDTGHVRPIPHEALPGFPYDEHLGVLVHWLPDNSGLFIDYNTPPALQNRTWAFLDTADLTVRDTGEGVIRSISPDGAYAAVEHGPWPITDDLTTPRAEIIRVPGRRPAPDARVAQGDWAIHEPDPPVYLEPHRVSGSPAGNTKPAARIIDPKRRSVRRADGEPEAGVYAGARSTVSRPIGYRYSVCLIGPGIHATLSIPTTSYHRAEIVATDRGGRFVAELHNGDYSEMSSPGSAIGNLTLYDFDGDRKLTMEDTRFLTMLPDTDTAIVMHVENRECELIALDLLTGKRESLPPMPGHRARCMVVDGRLVAYVYQREYSGGTKAGAGDLMVLSVDWTQWQTISTHAIGFVADPDVPVRDF